MSIAARIVTTGLDKAGIAINGNAPWDIQIRDERFYWRVLSQGSLGLGEAFMAGWWDCQSLDQFFERLLRNGLPWVERLSPPSVALVLKSKLRNLAPKHLAFHIGEVHYDLGNSLFESMLDSTMSYSCGYNFEELEGPNQLEVAQVAKLDLVCRKLGLEPGQRLLDIGCGWGGLAHHAASKYGVEVVGLTVSKEQADFGLKKCQHLPVDIRLIDYRDINEKFDRIASVGMFEHVGPKNHQTYMEMVARCLRPDGLFLLHTIGMNPRFNHPVDAWIMKYIFPGGEVPTRRQIIASSKGKELFAIRDWHEFGKNYDLTLMAWHNRFVAAWPELKDKYEHQVCGQFYRMWVYYLLSCAALFRTGNTKLWQVVLSHHNSNHDYMEVR